MTILAKINHLFSQVSSDYEHQTKSVRPGPALVTNGVYLKWSLIEPESLPITPSQIDGAQAFLLEGLSSGRLKLHNEIGFVVQHRCANVLILYVCTWRGDNEVWETLYHAADPGRSPANGDRRARIDGLQAQSGQQHAHHARAGRARGGAAVVRGAFRGWHGLNADHENVLGGAFRVVDGSVWDSMDGQLRRRRVRDSGSSRPVQAIRLERWRTLHSASAQLRFNGFGSDE